MVWLSEVPKVQLPSIMYDGSPHRVQVAGGGATEVKIMHIVRTDICGYHLTGYNHGALVMGAPH